MKKLTLLKLAAAAAACLPGAAAGADVAAVVSSQAGPYAEAIEGFRQTLDGHFDYYDAARQAPDDIRYVALFGARAAAGDYTPNTQVIYALAPLGGRKRDNWHEISMMPAPGPAMAAYKKLQPGLRRLAVFWASYPGEEYMDLLERAGEKNGVEIVPARIKGPDSFPDRLRRLLGRMDAFWVMPDPLLINESSIMVLTSFSCANAVPFYAPTHALVLNGASASFAPDFREAGTAAARALNMLRGGTELPAVIYPRKAELKVNAALAGKCRWPFSLD